MSQTDSSVSPTGQLYYRHALPIRLMHWINVLAFTLLLMSDLQIFNAHPALNWGKSSYTDIPALLEMEAQKNAQGEIVGITRLFGHEFYTTGVLAKCITEIRLVDRFDNIEGGKGGYWEDRGYEWFAGI